MNKTKRFSVLTCMLISFWMISFPLSIRADTGLHKTIVIVPFEANTDTDISYITSGILSMLTSRLSWKDKVVVLNNARTQKALSSITQSSSYDAFFDLERATHADFVITGVITSFSGSASVDAKVYNLKEKSYLTFFGQAKTIDELIAQVDIMAAKINKKVFNRTTVSYEKFEKQNIITQEELRRMNPERMMPVPNSLMEKEKPWWKIW